MSIVVTTPTGHIGSRVVERLLASGQPFTVVARDPAKLSAAVRAGATVVTGSLDDPGVLEKATVGASALFLLVPPNFRTDDPAGFSLSIGRLAADAVRVNGVSRVVFQSSAGAHRSDLRGVSRLGQIEKLLEAVAPNVTSLRAGFFYENLLNAVPTIASHSTFYLPFSPDQPITMVATQDIGDAAADALLDTSWQGHRVRGVHGPADHSMREVAALIGAQLGREVHYVQADFAGVQSALLGAGATPAVAEDLGALYVGLGTHAADHEARSLDTTGPTTLASFAATALVPAINAT
jgi:uncharacterized protein YbjT (DUF2867 family)